MTGYSTFFKKRKYRNWIPHVTSIIKKDGEVLLGLRSNASDQGGLWEFPGGRIDQDETPEIALKRNLSEKLGIEIEVQVLPSIQTYSTDTYGILFLFYHIEFWKGEPKRVFYSDLQWVTPQELPAINLIESIQNIIPSLQDLIRVFPQFRRDKA